MALDSLAAQPENWVIRTAPSGSCQGFAAGCTSTPNADGSYSSTTIILMPGDWPSLQRQMGIPVNGLIVFAHEMGHALTDRLPFCASDERCAIGLENATRFESGSRTLRRWP
jgi:hypothetical protein